MDDVWIETRDSTWVRADLIVDVSDSLWTTSAGSRGQYNFAKEGPGPGSGLALLKTIKQARTVARERESAVILSWHGDKAGWRIETLDAREDRFRAERQL